MSVAHLSESQAMSNDQIMYIECVPFHMIERGSLGMILQASEKARRHFGH